ncbi:MAG: D-alanine--D-alanine ligase family protein [Bacilli bacterium]
MKIRVGVIFGGESVEHEVSIITAVQAMEYIDQDKYEIVPIYISKDRTWYTGKMLMDIGIYSDFDNLKRYAKKVTLCRKNGSFYLQTITGVFKKNIAEIDIAFPIVHGNNVEDGTLAGYLDTLGIPYVGSRVLGSSLGQDKVVQKQVLASENLPIVDYVWFYDTEYYTSTEMINENINKLGYPVIVKPASLGSSVGISVVKKASDLDKAITEAIKYDTKILVEKMVSNLIEVNCAVLGNYAFQETSLIAEMLTDNDFLTYQDKYVGNGKGAKKGGSKEGMASSDFIIPARLDDKITNEIYDLSKKAFRALNLSGVARIDFLIDKKSKKVYINEPNTIPGCLSFYMFNPTGKNYTKLLDEMITIAIKDYKSRCKKTYSFDSNILSNYNGLKGGKGLKGMKNKLNM